LRDDGGPVSGGATPHSVDRDRLPAELNRWSHDKARGIVLRSDTLDNDETCVRDGIRLTTPARTTFDLGRRKGLTVAVIRLDALMHATELKAADVELLADRHRGMHGLVQLRQALLMADGGAESPYERKTRLDLIGGGLPRPHTLVDVLNDWGAVVARFDMGWEEWKVGVECDGAQHWTDPTSSWHALVVPCSPPAARSEHRRRTWSCWAKTA
jgi:hypothetical protein